MNINNIFEKFLEDQVDLNPARYERIKTAEDVLSKFIAQHQDFKDLYVTTISQGSYRQGTIIKPVDKNSEFDVDFLIEFKENTQWEPKTYILKLAEAFKKSGRYEDLTDTIGKTRCVTIDYEGDFHVDLVPTIRKDGKYFIFNKITNKSEETDGDGYAQWFNDKNKESNGHLVSAVKLIKYLRDQRKDFDTKSIIITTLVGMLFSNESHDDIMQSFTSILSNINNFLEEYSEPPLIANPAMPGETFNRHWKEDVAGYKSFKDAISTYVKIAEKASSLSGEEALKEWRKLFGDKFGVISSGNGDLDVNTKDNNSTKPSGFKPHSPWCAYDVNGSR